MPLDSDAAPTGVEIICEAGVNAGWALRVGTVFDDADSNGTTLRIHRVATVLEIEQIISDRMVEYGTDVARVVHTFGGRDIHLRDGSRVEFRWELVVSDWRCADCGIDTDAIGEYYMVLDPLWEQVDAGEGHLCIGCLEHRLGRALSASDFSDAAVNCDVHLRRSEALVARLAKSLIQQDS